MNAAASITTSNEGTTAFIHVAGDVTPAADQALADAHAATLDAGATKVALDFTELEYLNSGGIGLLVTLLVRAKRAKQSLVAYGLDDHYREIFSLTRLDDAIHIVADRGEVGA